MRIEKRFLKYVSFDTQADDESTSSPSTLKQLELAKFLKEEMEIIGFKNVILDEYGNVYGTIPANSEQGKAMGFIAHMDTATEASGKDVKPRLIHDYDGNVITINEEKGMVLDPEIFTSLKNSIGHDLIVTDGTTLLGGDDKAGIAIIMTMAEYLHNHPEYLHNDLYVAFTTDEEVGRGTENFDLDYFECDFAYTVDGGDINEFSYENFNAYRVSVNIHGKPIHPGDAKGKLINASTLGIEYNSMLPIHEVPENTEGREGFHHLIKFDGATEYANLEYIVRDHDFDLIKKKLNDFKRIEAYMNSLYKYQCVEVSVKQQYLNMKDIIMEDANIVSLVLETMKEIDLTPRVLPIRGGTDGAMLSYKGLPCPNIGTGDFNCHGPYEYVDVYQMKKGVELLLKMIQK